MLEDIVAILVIFGGIPIYMGFRAWLKHTEYMAEMRSRGQIASSNVAPNEFSTLKDEITSLRQMTTQYALSVEHTMTEFGQRLEHLESKTASGPRNMASPKIEAPEEQNITLGS